MDFLSNVGRREQVTVNEAGRFVTLGDKSLNGYERNALFHNAGQLDSEGLPNLRDEGFIAGADLIQDGRAIAATDLDRDGQLDLIVQNFARPTSVLVHEQPAAEADAHWLQIKLHDETCANRDALGARVTVHLDGNRRLVREVMATAGYLAGQSTVVHFGLGDSDRVEAVEVRWPDGGRDTFDPGPVDRRVEMRRDATQLSALSSTSNTGR